MPNNKIYLVYRIKEMLGKNISEHSLKGKPEHSVEKAYFPYVIKSLRKTYDYFAVFKKEFKDMSEEDKKKYNSRLKYIDTVLYPKFLEADISVDSFAHFFVEHKLSQIEKLFGNLHYNDTLSYSQTVDPEHYKIPDWNRLNYFYEQLILKDSNLNAQQRFHWIKTLFKIKDNEDIQVYIDTWKTNPKYYDRVLTSYKNDIHNAEWYIQRWRQGVINNG